MGIWADACNAKQKITYDFRGFVRTLRRHIMTRGIGVVVVVVVIMRFPRADLMREQRVPDYRANARVLCKLFAFVIYNKKNIRFGISFCVCAHVQICLVELWCAVWAWRVLFASHSSIPACVVFCVCAMGRVVGKTGPTACCCGPRCFLINAVHLSDSSRVFIHHNVRMSVRQHI